MQILSISIYWSSSDIPKVPFGKRATLYPGIAPLQHILGEEVAGDRFRKQQPGDIDWDARLRVEGDSQRLREGGLETGRSENLKRSGKMLIFGKKARFSSFCSH
jgi:hypothetical protein